jgi:hypothetical protein
MSSTTRIKPFFVARSNVYWPHDAALLRLSVTMMSFTFVVYVMLRDFF